MQTRRDLTPKKPFEGKYADLNEKIIKIFYQVHNELGYGFSEKVYQKAFGIALREIGLKWMSKSPSRFTIMVKWWASILLICLSTMLFCLS